MPNKKCNFFHASCALLSITEPPPTPQNLSILDIQSRSVKVAWNVEAASPAVERLVVQWKEQTGKKPFQLFCIYHHELSWLRSRAGKIRFPQFDAFSTCKSDLWSKFFLRRGLVPTREAKYSSRTNDRDPSDQFEAVDRLPFEGVCRKPAGQKQGWKSATGMKLISFNVPWELQKRTSKSAIDWARLVSRDMLCRGIWKFCLCSFTVVS